VLVRTLGKVSAYTVCSRQAALLGPVAAAANNLMFNLGVATTQVCESVAVATQTLLAREIGKGGVVVKEQEAKNKKKDKKKERSIQQQEEGGENGESRSESGEKAAVAEVAEEVALEARLFRVSAWHVIKRGCVSGGCVAAALSVATWVNRAGIVKGLTSSPDIQQACLSIMPVVLLTQVAKGLAYPVNGVVMGGLDWTFSTAAMWAANLGCLAVLRWGSVVFSAASSGALTAGVVTPTSPLSAPQSLANIWAALATFMWIQVVASLVRVASGTGTWASLRQRHRRPPSPSSQPTLLSVDASLEPRKS